MTARIPIGFFVLAAAFLATAHAQDVTVTLSPEQQEVVQGQRPHFVALVRANERVRVINLARRPDVQERLVKPRLSAATYQDDLPVWFSELKPIGESDYLVLAPGKTMQFEYDGAPFRFDKLEPGGYKVSLRYRKDMSSRIVESNPVAFRVIAAPPPAQGERR